MASLLDVIIGAFIGALLGLLTGILTQWIMTNHKSRLRAKAALYAIQAEMKSNDNELDRALFGFRSFPSNQAGESPTGAIASVVQLLPWIDDAVMLSELTSVALWIPEATLENIETIYKRSRILARNYVHEPWLRELLAQQSFKDTTVGILQVLRKKHSELDKKISCDIRNLTDLHWWQLWTIPARISKISTDS